MALPALMPDISQYIGRRLSDPHPLLGLYMNQLQFDTCFVINTWKKWYMSMDLKLQSTIANDHVGW